MTHDYNNDEINVSDDDNDDNDDNDDDDDDNNLTSQITFLPKFIVNTSISFNSKKLLKFIV